MLITWRITLIDVNVTGISRIIGVYLRTRLRAVSLFSWSVEQIARDTQMTTRVTEGARRQSSRARTPLTKSEEKERLLAVYLRTNNKIIPSSF